MPGEHTHHHQLCSSNPENHVRSGLKIRHLVLLCSSCSFAVPSRCVARINSHYRWQLGAQEWLFQGATRIAVKRGCHVPPEVVDSLRPSGNSDAKLPTRQTCLVSQIRIALITEYFTFVSITVRIATRTPGKSLSAENISGGFRTSLKMENRLIPSSISTV